MCVLVVVFSIFISFFESLKIFDLILKFFGIELSHESICSFIRTIFEVTQACSSISGSNFVLMLSFAVGWAGLCVHFQIFSIIGSLKLNYRKFFFFRLIHSSTAVILTFIILKFQRFKISRLVIPEIQFPMSTHIFGSIALIVCCLYFLIDLNISTKSRKET